MALPPAWAARMHRIAFGLLVGGLLAFAGNELWWSASLVPAALAGWPQQAPDLPRVARALLDVGDLLAPAAMVLLLSLALTRSLPAHARRATYVAFALLAASFAIMAIHWPIARESWAFWLPSTVGVTGVALAYAALGWPRGRRALLLAGAALFALRFPILGYAQHAYVVASGEPARMQAALAWNVAPGVVSALGLALLAIGMMAPRGASGKAYPASDAMSAP